MASPQDYLGAPVEEVDTPALLVDLDIIEGNLRRMASFLESGQAVLRPHVKTHKCPELALRQIEYGARGITCAKLGEAEVMVQGGVADILIANQVVGKTKIGRLMELAGRVNLTVAVDSAENALDLSSAAQQRGVEVGVLVEVDVGMHRCGVAPGQEAVRLCHAVAGLKGLRFVGLMGYEGHAVFLPDRQQREEECRKAMGLLVDAVLAVEASGLEVKVVSAGGTGTYDVTGRYPRVTEIQAGSYVLMDATYRRIVPEFECALTLLTTVISRPTETRVIVDVGRKGISDDFGLPVPADRQDLAMVSLSEEHGKLEASGRTDLRVGDKIELLPSHCCTTINLHDVFYCHRQGRVEAVWSIAGRGKLQ